jgi:hypothetical protein
MVEYEDMPVVVLMGPRDLGACDWRAEYASS